MQVKERQPTALSRLWFQVEEVRDKVLKEKTPTSNIDKQISRAFNSSILDSKSPRLQEYITIVDIVARNWVISPVFYPPRKLLAAFDSLKGNLNFAAPLSRFGALAMRALYDVDISAPVPDEIFRELRRILVEEWIPALTTVTTDPRSILHSKQWSTAPTQRKRKKSQPP